MVYLETIVQVEMEVGKISNFSKEYLEIIVQTMAEEEEFLEGVEEEMEVYLEIKVLSLKEHKVTHSL